MLSAAVCGIPIRRFLRAIWVLITLFILGSIPWMLIEFKRSSYSIHYQAWLVAGIFVLLAVSVSVYEIAMNLEYYNYPRLQIRVVRILWMVPMYAVNSWLCLRFKDASFYIDPIRECYEAFVIYNFYMYLVTYLEDEVGDPITYFSTKEQVDHLWPANKFLSTWHMGRQFFDQTQRGVLAYVITRPLMAAISVLANMANVYCEGEFHRGCVWPYVALINSTSQMWALYCLVLLYEATKKELEKIRPLPKFIAIKSVVFLTFWQSLVIAIAAKVGLVRSKDWSTYDTDDVAEGLQNFLICVEMFFAALGHAHAFPPRDYMDPSRPPAGLMNNVKVMFDVGDVMSDVSGLMTGTRDGLVDMVTKPLNAVGIGGSRRRDDAVPYEPLEAGTSSSQRLA
mmetsp:Transcript_5864/g.16425  ORF Transcript_5864/g.16425 Transcript_5864/m.16425 type:complete len:395 (+) Transcript_5864:201-1385(+)